MAALLLIKHQGEGSDIPIDQALEKQYNKPAKGPSELIGFTRRKQVLFKWNIIKHEKLEAEDQYSLHHDFSKCTADSERAAVEKMVSYINERGNLFVISVTVTKNIASGKKMDDELVTFKAGYLVIGEEKYQKYKDERLEVIMLFDPVKKVKMKSCSILTQTPRHKKRNDTVNAKY